MKNAYLKYLLALLLFGSNGIVASHISLNSYEIVLLRSFTGITGLKNSMYQLSLSFLVVGLFTVIKQGVAIDIAPENILPILILGVVNTGVGCYLYFSSIPRLPAQSVAICGYLEPVSALIFSMIFLNERLTPVQLAGTVLILGGAAFGEFYKRSKSDPPLCRNE